MIAYDFSSTKIYHILLVDALEKQGCSYPLKPVDEATPILFGMFFIISVFIFASLRRLSLPLELLFKPLLFLSLEVIHILVSLTVVFQEVLIGALDFLELFCFI